MMSLFSKRNLFLIITFLLIIFIFLFFYTANRSYELTVNFIDDSNTQTITIFRSSSPEKGAIKEISTRSNKTSLPSGDYILVAEESEKFKAYSERITLDKNIVADVKLTYNRQYLVELLNTQEADIKKVIEGGVAIPQGYKINNGSLLKDVDWYGTTLSVDSVGQLNIDPKNADIYRVVVQKTNGVWKVVTLPPEITISNVIYTDIPKEVIRLTNLMPVDINDAEQTRWQNEL